MDSPTAINIGGVRPSIRYNPAQTILGNSSTLLLLDGHNMVGVSGLATTPDAGLIPTIVLRQGRRGATIHRRGEADVHVDAVPLGSIADTSGAGDVHVGANLAALAMGLSWPDAVLLANRAAAYSVSRAGPASVDQKWRAGTRLCREPRLKAGAY